MKKFLVFLAIVAIVCTFAVSAQTEERGSIQINNTPLSEDVYYVKGDKGFYIPVRAVCEAIGCTVDWIDETQTVVIKRNGEEARIQIGAESFSFDGTGNRYISYRCNPATFIDGKTYAPLSVILECFDGARKHFEDTGLLLIVAYPTYKDASVLVDLGIISQEDFEKEGYITNAEALKTISVAINSNTEKADLAR
ncbi:MAG: copper amine oxidase N-terminal domain-containing protein [Clostridia bacterium]|nr:copper amine oxidase N-terminal domain-containing protein [Clostridia bacterium]